jgi:hypothetical protein
MWEPRRLTTLWASMACYRVSSTFYLAYNLHEICPFVLIYNFSKMKFLPGFLQVFQSLGNVFLMFEDGKSWTALHVNLSCWYTYRKSGSPWEQLAGRPTCRGRKILSSEECPCCATAHPLYIAWNLCLSQYASLLLATCVASLQNISSPHISSLNSLKFDLNWKALSGI